MVYFHPRNFDDLVFYILVDQLPDSLTNRYSNYQNHLNTIMDGYKVILPQFMVRWSKQENYNKINIKPYKHCVCLK